MYSMNGLLQSVLHKQTSVVELFLNSSEECV